MSAAEEAERHYQRGYRAGRKERDREEREFWQQAFVAALSKCISASGWTDGKGNAITSRTARTQLAAGFADDALAERRKRF